MATRSTNSLTVQKLVLDLIASQQKPAQWAKAAEILGLRESQLRMWMNPEHEDRTLRLAASQRVAAYFGVPLEAVLLKRDPIDAVCRRLEAQIKKWRARRAK